MKKRNYKIGIITLTLIFVFNLVLMSVSSVFAANQYGQTGAKNEEISGSGRYKKNKDSLD